MPKTSHLEECPPDELLTGFTIHVAQGVSQQHSDKTWSVHCPQWRFHGHTENLTRLIACLVAEIESHNAECEGYPPVHKDFNAWAAKNGFAELRKEHWPKPAPTLRGTGRLMRRLQPMPDDGKKTPNRSLTVG